MHKIQLNDSFINYTDVIRTQMLCFKGNLPRLIKSMIIPGAIYKFICPCPSLIYVMFNLTPEHLKLYRQ